MLARSRNVPRKQALEMLTAGRFLGVGEAARIGLINRAVPDAELITAIADLAATITRQRGSAGRRGKQAFDREVKVPFDTAYAFTDAKMMENMPGSKNSGGRRGIPRETPAGMVGMRLLGPTAPLREPAGEAAIWPAHG